MLVLFFLIFTLFDAEFVKILLNLDETAWQALSDESVPPEQHLEMFADLTEKVAHTVSRGFLTNNLVNQFPPNQGEAVLLKGNVLFVTKLSSKKTLYRCRMELQNGIKVDIFIPAVPNDWKLNTPILERSAAYGVYVKSYQKILIFAAPAIQWFPNTWLGNLDFDVGSFDQVPAKRVIDLDQNDEETNRQLFKFTEFDREPFYGLLKAVSVTPAGWLEQEAKKQNTKLPIAVTDLFNNPAETRGKPVLLYGTAKRIVKVPVTDSEVQSLFGIDHYYQIYLFTEKTQGNPIVICVHSLSEGLPTGDAANFSEQIAVAAVPYKLWIYETKNMPHYAPLLIGRSPIWYPKPAGQQKPPESFTAVSLTIFFVLMLIWFGCRYWIKK